jgi:hypothetical protein
VRTPAAGPAACRPEATMSFFIAATITVVTAVGLLVALIALLLQPNVEELIQGNWVSDASDADGSAVHNG